MKSTGLLFWLQSQYLAVMCLYFDNGVQAYPPGGTAYNTTIVTGPHLVVVALKVA